MSQDPIATVRQIVMMFYDFRIKALQGKRIAQVIKKQLALLRDLIEGDVFNA